MLQLSLDFGKRPVSVDSAPPRSAGLRHARALARGDDFPYVLRQCSRSAHAHARRAPGAERWAAAAGA